MNAADLFKQSVKNYRKTINPPYTSPKEYLIIGVTLFLLLTIPVTIISVFQARDLGSKASTPQAKINSQKPAFSFPDQILVKFKGGVSQTDIDYTLKQFGLTIASQVSDSNLLIVKVPADKKDIVLSALTQNPRIISATSIEADEETIEEGVLGEAQKPKSSKP